jgi:tetratricopeptide (TPR) repeat protein
MASNAIPPGSSDEGPGKGQAFFDRAKVVAETGNFDYAIDMIIEGLNREPENVGELERLYNVSLTRKVKGGKPAGGLLGAKGPYKGKTPKEQMLNAIFVLAKDPGHIPSMMTILKSAQAAKYIEVVKFFGPIATHANRTSKTPKKDIYIDLATVYEEVGDFTRAQEAVHYAMQLDKDDMTLESWLKNLAANQTIKKGKYGEEDKGFKESLKDTEETKKLLQEENLVKSDDYKATLIETTRADYEKNPTEMQVISKYVKALVNSEQEVNENLAIEVLQKAYVETKTYRYKFQLGEIRLRQHARAARQLREAFKANPTDKELSAKLEKSLKDLLAFELSEYKERTENFPTDMPMLFEYGKRLYMSHRYEEAIAALQVAQNNAKYRAEALHILGKAFMQQNMKHEAMETLKKATEEYEFAESGDGRSKEFFYQLAIAYEDNGRGPEAMQIYSKIAQWDIGYKDVRVRLANLRNSGGSTPSRA